MISGAVGRVVQARHPNASSNGRPTPQLNADDSAAEQRSGDSVSGFMMSPRPQLSLERVYLHVCTFGWIRHRRPHDGHGTDSGNLLVLGPRSSVSPSIMADSGRAAYHVSSWCIHRRPRSPLMPGRRTIRGRGSCMAFKVVATPFGRNTDTSYPHEHEGLKPLGITIETADVSSDEAYLNSIRDADAVIAGGKWLNGDVLNKLERCKVIANGGVGVDRIDLDAATERGIVVTNVPDVFVEEVAVHAMMLILACAKKVVNLDRAVRENRWGEGRNYLKPMPRVVGDTIGLIPFGNIPRLVAKKARGFDMHVIAWDPFVDDAVFAAAGVERVTD